MAEGTAPRTIIGTLPLMAEALLLTVTTINRRVAEQIKQGKIGQNDTLENVEIVGLLDGFKIVVRENARLSWLHDSDFVEFLVRTRGMSYNDAWDETRKIPQLFAV